MNRLLAVRRISFNFRNNKKESERNKKWVPFVTTYDPKSKALNKIIKGNLLLLHINNKVRKSFTPSTKN